MTQKEKPFRTRNTGKEDWYTPPKYVELAWQVMGGIDLDPASCEEANQYVQATQYFDRETNGLFQNWHGRVFLNPPYSRGTIEPFVTKLLNSYPAKVSQAILLINNATETKWFQQAVKACTALCFPEKRIKFLAPKGAQSNSPLQGQAFLYYGERRYTFIKVFSTIGTVLVTDPLTDGEYLAEKALKQAREHYKK